MRVYYTIVDVVGDFMITRILCRLSVLLLREKHKGRKPRGESTDALAWGGPARTSDEGSVMGLERRGRVRQS